MKSKSASESSIESRRIVMPDHINTNGTLFGGVLMSWIDKCALMTAQRFSGRGNVVTAQIENLIFHLPLRIGDHVFLSARVEYAGRSSMAVAVAVDRESLSPNERTRAATANLTFVALDDGGKPTSVPQLLLEGDRDRTLYQRARLRLRARERLNAWLEKRFPIPERENLLKRVQLS